MGVYRDFLSPYALDCGCDPRLQTFQRERINAKQRIRRAKRHRIDYYVSKAAFAIFNPQIKPQAGYDASSVINRIVESAAPFTDLSKACAS